MNLQVWTGSSTHQWILLFLTTGLTHRVTPRPRNVVDSILGVFGIGAQVSRSLVAASGDDDVGRRVHRPAQRNLVRGPRVAWVATSGTQTHQVSNHLSGSSIERVQKAGIRFRTKSRGSSTAGVSRTKTFSRVTIPQPKTVAWTGRTWNTFWFFN